MDGGGHDRGWKALADCESPREDQPPPPSGVVVSPILRQTSQKEALEESVSGHWTGAGT